jgi:peptidoglycan/LPS O-acetylase OafA/YrhL
MKSIKSIYFEQLNGIRFLAVFLVLLDHWLIPINPFSFLGHLGVVIFFVLSGFLITRILFQNAENYRLNHTSLFVEVVRFIYRRSLRIFPIYYLLLFIGFLFSISEFSNVSTWLITYTPNFYIIINQKWMGVWDHLWSLAVEEQYYLLFPYFIFFIPASNYPRLFLSMILIGIGTRVSFYFLSSHEMKESFWMVSYVNPLAAIDSFGLGGTLAYLYHFQKSLFQKLVSFIYLIPFSLILFLSVIYLGSNSDFAHDNIWFLVFERFFAGIFAFLLIAQAVAESTWTFGAFLRLAWVSYLGQISYGIYLYHNIVYNYYHVNGNTIIGFLTKYLSILSSELPTFIALKFVLSLLILIGIASVSWFIIEKPISRFKNRI